MTSAGKFEKRYICGSRRLISSASLWRAGESSASLRTVLGQIDTVSSRTHPKSLKTLTRGIAKSIQSELGSNAVNLVEVPLIHA